MHFIIFLCASIFGNIGMYIMYITADNIVSSVLYYIPKLFDLMMCVTIREDMNQQLLMNNMQPISTCQYNTSTESNSTY